MNCCGSSCHRNKSFLQMWSLGNTVDEFYNFFGSVHILVVKELSQVGWQVLYKLKRSNTPLISCVNIISSYLQKIITSANFVNVSLFLSLRAVFFASFSPHISLLLPFTSTLSIRKRQSRKLKTNCQQTKARQSGNFDCTPYQLAPIGKILCGMNVQ